MRIRTGNKRRKRAGRWDPVTCPRHGLAIRGDGWVHIEGHRLAAFRCPKPRCTHHRLIDLAKGCEPSGEAYR